MSENVTPAATEAAMRAAFDAMGYEDRLEWASLIVPAPWAVQLAEPPRIPAAMTHEEWEADLMGRVACMSYEDQVELAGRILPSVLQITARAGE